MGLDKIQLLTKVFVASLKQISNTGRSKNPLVGSSAHLFSLALTREDGSKLFI
ncbi:hypothetical protein BH11BAC3_BH11BAC3_23730 [soil metagenome]